MRAACRPGSAAALEHQALLVVARRLEEVRLEG
jgi:hypothetical protein